MGRIATAKCLALLLWGGATAQAALRPATEVGHADADPSAPWAARFREGLRDAGRSASGESRGGGPECM